MIQKLSAGIALGVGLAAFQLASAPSALAKDLKVLSENTVTGFGHVESVAYDPRGKVFYVSDFGPELKSADKDGKGKITKISLDGKILEDGFLPAKGQVLNKPKGNLDPKRPVVGDRHRLGLGIRSQDQGRQEA